MNINVTDVLLLIAAVLIVAGFVPKQIVWALAGLVVVASLVSLVVNGGAA